MLDTRTQLLDFLTPTLAPFLRFSVSLRSTPQLSPRKSMLGSRTILNTIQTKRQVHARRIHTKLGHESTGW